MVHFFFDGVKCVFMLFYGGQREVVRVKKREVYFRKRVFLFLFGKGGEVRLEPFFNMCDLLHLKRSEI